MGSASLLKGKRKMSTMAMKAIADGELWTWHVSVGHARSINDLKIRDNFRTMYRILVGKFPHRILYNIHGTTRTFLYHLPDGIYPPWAIFVKTAKRSTERELRCFSAHRKGVVKDVERAFGAPIAQYHILRRPCRMWDKNGIMQVFWVCVVFQYICCEALRDK